MGREEEHSNATLLFWEFLESSMDILGDSLVSKLDTKGREGVTHLARMCTPTINDASTNTRKQTSSALSINIVKTTARRGATVQLC